MYVPGVFFGCISRMLLCMSRMSISRMCIFSDVYFSRMYSNFLGCKLSRMESFRMPIFSEISRMKSFRMSIFSDVYTVHVSDLQYFSDLHVSENKFSDLQSRNFLGSKRDEKILGSTSSYVNFSYVRLLGSDFSESYLVDTSEKKFSDLTRCQKKHFSDLTHCQIHVMFTSLLSTCQNPIGQVQIVL